jgi:hypothetical protein
MRNRFPLVLLTTLLSLTGMASAQSGRSLTDLMNDNRKETIVVNVWASATPAVANSVQPDAAVMSRDFAVAGLKAASTIRELQRQLAYAIQNGYPLAEFWIRIDRDRARDALTKAALSASTNADRKALEQLANQNENLRAWSDWLIEANRNLRLASYYKSAAALDNDPLFQKTVACTRFLIPMLASGKVAEDYSCR